MHCGPLDTSAPLRTTKTVESEDNQRHTTALRQSRVPRTPPAVEINSSEHLPLCTVAAKGAYGTCPTDEAFLLRRCLEVFNSMLHGAANLTPAASTRDIIPFLQ